MADKIRILIVDDLPETRENVRKLLQFEPDVEVVGQAGNGQEAIDLARQQQPDIILMDINMPIVDGISASQSITQSVPQCQIIIMSVQSEADYLRQAMLAGARDFLMKPFSGDELMAAIRRVHETRPTIIHQPVSTGSAPSSGDQGHTEPLKAGNVIAVYSPKGGSGCTTLAINTAVALATRGHKTLLLDANLQFGDVAVTLNMRPTSTIVDLADRVNELDADLISSVSLEHDSGLRVLLASPKPEMADLITAETLESIIGALRNLFDFVIIDTASGLHDTTITVLDSADRIVLVAQQSLASLTNARRFFDLYDALTNDIKKILLIVNRTSDKFGISVKDVSDALRRPVVASVVQDDLAVTNAADRGMPILSKVSKKTPLINSMLKFVDELEIELTGETHSDTDSNDGGNKKTGWFGWLGR